MNTQTSYANKKAQLLLAVLLTVLVSVFIPNLVQAQTYSEPLVISKGGTYTGNWESRDSEVPAVDVRTSEPVVIVNSNIRGAGYLIKSWGHGANITIRHTNGYGITPTAWRDYIKSRRFLTVDVFRNVVVENCYMEGTAGIFVGEQYVGNGTTSESIKIRYNKAKNIDGRVQGDTDLVQFVQFNFRGDVRGAEIAWNQVINEPGKSAVEDNINLFNSRGTSDSPIRIHNNYIEGAYPNPATGNEYSGGGIISDTNAGLDQATRYVDAHDNHLVNLGNYSMGIAGGNNIRYHHNRAINSATFKDGTRFNMYTSGLWSADYYKMGTTFSNSIDNNVVGIMAWGWDNDRNDFTVNQYASYSNNTNLSGTITLATEAAEFNLWQQKLTKNGIVLGPNGSGATTSPTITETVTAPTTETSTSTTTTTSGGKITREFWSNVTTGSVSSIPTTNPTSKSELTLFEAPQNVGHDYGQRVKGYVTAPTTGNYTFWISSDDNSELYLSTSEDPAKKVKIASITGWTNSREYTKFASQKSATIALEAGKRYYIEAAMVDIDGGDHLSVGWQLPNGTQERPIAGNRLSPMGSVATTTTTTTPTNQAPAITLTSPKTGTSFTAGTAITLSATATDADGTIAKVEFFQGSTKIGESTQSPYSYNWANAAAGSYTITAKATDNAGATKVSTAASITVTALTSTAPSTGTTTGTTTGSTSGTGKITREFWSNVTTGSVSSIPTSNPTSKSELTLFEAPQNIGHDYGQRVKGYVTAPTTGNYTFWISSDDNSELYLSTSEDPAKKVKIASITGWTNSREYTKFASQKSATIALEAGKRYYIEAAMVDIDGGDHLSVGWQLPNGTQERPIAGNRLSPMGSVATTTTTITAPVASTPTTTTTIATGKITRQFWSNVTGTSVAAVPTSNPTSTSELTLFEAPQNVGDDYGQRIKGYVTAPTSGNYTFWIASDDYSELYLSTSEDPAKKVKIASVTGWTNSREYTKFASQKSATIALEAGKRYYIEAVMMDVYGGDHLSVGWQLPNGTQERPIAGNRLSPIGSTTDAGSITLASASTAETTDTDISFTDVTAYPNPFKTVLTLDMGSQNVKLQSVVITTQDGTVKYKEENLQLVNNKLEMDLSSARLKRGIYILKYTDSNGNSKSLKVVKE